VKRQRIEIVPILLGCLFVCSTAADAQQLFERDQCVALFNEVAEARVVSRELKRTPLGASDTAPNLNTESTLSAGNEGGRAFLSFAPKKKVQVGDVRPALKISVPFDDDTGEGIFASRAGVGGDIVFSASLARYGWDLEIASYGEELCDRCQAAGVAAMADCYPENTAVFSEAEREEGALEQLIFGRVITTMWGVEGSIGRKARKYFTAAAEEESEDRVAMAFSAMGGLHLQQSSIFAKLTGKRDYDEGDTVQRCTGVEDALGLESCKQLPFGRAEEKESLVAAVEMVRQFKGFALAPGADYDIEESEWTLRLPIFLVRNDDDDWVAGLKLAWSSDAEDEFGAAIFVTKPLDF
jgi:hypothetical protein